MNKVLIMAAAQALIADQTKKELADRQRLIITLAYTMMCETLKDLGIDAKPTADQVLEFIASPEGKDELYSRMVMVGDGRPSPKGLLGTPVHTPQKPKPLPDKKPVPMQRSTGLSKMLKHKGRR